MYMYYLDQGQNGKHYSIQKFFLGGLSSSCFQAQVSKGQEMSFCYPQFSQKTNKWFNFTTMVPQVELFSFVFWENWRHLKEVSKLTDL